MKTFLPVFLITWSLVFINCYHDPIWRPNRSVIVHLFDWKWMDIANECEQYLAPNGFAGVQISPPNENAIVVGRPWYERYQPMSYKLTTRSGNEAAFTDMTRRCNAVGIRIYVDLLLNHMSATSGTGTGGSVANALTRDFPAVPYTKDDFNSNCEIQWNDAASIRNCELLGLPDLNQNLENIRQKLANFMNHLIDLGVAGFRVDAMRHMWPGDLQNIWGRLKNVNTNFGFPRNTRPFIVGEVTDTRIYGSDYIHLGTVTEFRYGESLSNCFRGNDNLKWLRTFGEGWGFHHSKNVLSFVDNHDTQRDNEILTYRDGRLYKMAIAFHLAWPYGVSRIMSSFDFSERAQGPPHDGYFNIISPTFDSNGQCNNGWICEHRWHQISNMVGFKNVASEEEVSNWWDNDDNQISFSRGNYAFIAFNGQYRVDLSSRLQTGLPSGTYCDLASGLKEGSRCTGTSLTVGSDGFADVYLSSDASEGFVAFHIKSKL